MQQISPKELQQWLQDEAREKPFMLDVREPWEYEYCHLENARLLPMNQVPQQYSDLDKDADIVVICHHGVRSYQVARFLEHYGFAKVYNLQGGMDGWARDVDPSMRKY